MPPDTRFVEPAPARFRALHLDFVTAPEPKSPATTAVAAPLPVALPAEPLRTPVAVAVAIARSPSPIDDELVRTILEPLPLGEAAHDGFARKHAAIIALFDRLTAEESTALRDRLADPKPGDAANSAFARISGDRRSRLLAYLADAPRRELLHRARPRR